MINWKDHKAALTGASKYLIKGVFQFVHSVTSESVDTPDASFGVFSAIDDSGQGLDSLIDATGAGVTSLITSSLGVVSLVDSSGKGLTSLIDTTGQGVESEI